MNVKDDLRARRMIHGARTLNTLAAPTYPECPGSDKHEKVFAMTAVACGLDVRGMLQATLFGRLEPPFLDALASHARVERYEIPTLLNAAHLPLQHLRLVVEGRIGLVVRRASGNEVALADIGAGAWATWLPCFVPEPPAVDFYASGPSLFIALPVTHVRAFVERHPQIYPWVLAEIDYRMKLLAEWTAHSVLTGSKQRMARLIHILARDQKLKGNSGTLVVNQSRLACLARCARQTANTLLSQLERQGLIELSYGEVKILDMRELLAFADEESVD
ncbi:Crp/Fnr family transcriptional regulator [Variovorax humicola]|uniref:Crp/Fnr family transcriptional regulator n=1 Tax=Variovorax humicola TaxID=1769758 RepID=A0ABU8WDU3_9BURK